MYPPHTAIPVKELMQPREQTLLPCSGYRQSQAVENLPDRFCQWWPALAVEKVLILSGILCWAVAYTFEYFSVDLYFLIL